LQFPKHEIAEEAGLTRSPVTGARISTTDRSGTRIAIVFIADSAQRFKNNYWAPNCIRYPEIWATRVAGRGISRQGLWRSLPLASWFHAGDAQPTRASFAVDRSLGRTRLSNHSARCG